MFNRRMFQCIALAAGVAVGSTVIAADKATTKPAASTPATTTPPAKPAKRTGTPAALTKAIDALNKEFKDFAAKPDDNKLRDTSNYFTSGLTEETTVDDILNVLDHNMSGPPTQVAYVKWQLLSACPSKFDGKQAERVFNVYRSAPMPLPRFSFDAKTKQLLDRAIQSLKDGQETEINAQVDKQHAVVDAANNPILEFRDDLYSHLPTTADTLIARVQDAVARVQLGIKASDIAKDIKAEIRGWTPVDAKPQQANALLQAMAQADKTKGPVIYTKAKVPDNQTKLKWDDTPLKLDFKDAEDALKEYLANPQGSSLQFKK